jgi:outer membrane protein OmpA-like peptidoglycan-associated protein
MTSMNAKSPAHALTAVAISAITFWALAACTASASFQGGGAEQPTAAPPPPPPPPPPAETAPAPTATTTPPAAPTTTTTAPPAPPRKSTVSVKSDSILVPGVIEFDDGMATLKANGVSDAALEELRLFLEQNPRVTKLRIEGYTDNVGKAEDNENLSGMRSLAIKKWLVDKGVAKDRLIAAGFGQKSPVADNSTPEGRVKNKRIEFKLAELGGKKYLGRDLNGGGKVFDLP